MCFSSCFRGRAAVFLALAVAAAATGLANAADFSVSPIRAELKPGAMSETITVSNDSSSPLRVTVKVMAWTQDAAGQDLYADSNDLVYFPRQMDVEPGAKRLVRVGAKSPGQGAERTYRLFIEEVPQPTATGKSAVSFYFRFGVPVFVPPVSGKAQPELLQPSLEKGKLRFPVANRGNQHFRPTRISVADDAGWSREVSTWYSLAGSSRRYEADIPPEVCRKAKILSVKLETEVGSFDRKLDVDPASCS